MKTYVGVSLEAPHWVVSNKYPQLIFLWRNKKKILSVYPSYLSGAMSKYLERAKFKVNIFSTIHLLINDQSFL